MYNEVLEKESLFLDFEEGSSEEDIEEEVLTAKQEVILDFDHRADNLAKHFMEQFFANHSLHTGGPIPRNLLHNERRVSKVVNLSIMEAVDLAYAAMGTVHEGPVNNKKEVVHDDTKAVVSILHMLAEAKVPQRFSGGMLCVYLELVEGFEF